MERIHVTVGPQTIHFRASLTVKDVENKIRERCVLQGGGLEFDNLALVEGDVFVAGTTYSFVGGIPLAAAGGPNVTTAPIAAPAATSWANFKRNFRPSIPGIGRRQNGAAANRDVESIAAMIAPLRAQLQSVAETLNSQIDRTDVALRLMSETVFRNFNAYAAMTQTTGGKDDTRQKQFRTDYYNEYKITDGPVVENNTNGLKQAVCVLTGRAGKNKLSHLLPASTSNDIKNLLKLRDEDIWSFRNALLLCINIENAFDRCKFSLQPHPLYENHYTTKIWDDAVKDTMIWDGATESEIGTKDNTIGFYEGKTLDLTAYNPFKRCLSYQNFICFYLSNLKNKLVPADFSSALGDPDNWQIKRNDLMLARSDLDRDIMLETNDDDY